LYLLELIYKKNLKDYRISLEEILG
jgi:hypothetical protein